MVLSSSRDLEAGTSLDIDFADRHALPDDFPWRQNLATENPREV
jgi:hypothetical protein